LTAGYIGSDREFWWDALERLVLMPGSLPSNLRVTICGHTHQWTFDKTADYSVEACERHSRWGTFDEPPTERHKAYREMWTLMGPLREETRRDAVDELFAAAHLESTARETHRLLNRSEVLQLSCNNLIRFGAHSMTHSMLSSLDLVQQREEIVGSKAALEALSGLPVTTFAYPYGQKQDYTDETVTLVREASFKAACSNFPGLLTPHTDIFEIPRVQVYDCDGSQFDRLLDSWLV
jgi:peptidoglycan/xylan/chitin deacetylase (PgdA/CDA1 family)